MSEMVRFEIIIDSVATGEFLQKLRPFPEVTCSIHRSQASQNHGNIVTEDDLSDSLSYNLILAFVAKKSEATFVKAMKPFLKKYDASVYVSSCTEV